MLRSKLKWLYKRLRYGLQSFQLDSENFFYFCHPYNFTWANERAVEVALMKKEIQDSNNMTLLEVGNVLSHYLPTNHTIVDKYEKAPGVLNQDIINYNPRKKFDRVISISTLEHVGLDEKGEKATKAVQALAHIKTLLKKNGKAVISWPIGYNKVLDRVLAKPPNYIDSVKFLKRIDTQNHWQEATYAQIKNSKYNHPFPNANAIAIVTLINEPRRSRGA